MVRNLKIFMKNNNQKGYAILFTVILVSIISLIGIGLSNTTYKQLLISSGAKDSQESFFQSDMASECGLYADIKLKITNESISSFKCGIDVNGNPYTLEFANNGGGYYTLKNKNQSEDPCFEIKINKTDNATSVDTKIRASGYNVCDKSGIRNVERTVEVNY